MARVLELRLLGPFSARWSDGQNVELKGRKARALLAFLAIEPRGASREQAAALLWGELGDERARHNVRQTLSAIRRACGPVVATHAGRMELDTELCAADVRTFRRLAEATDRDDLSRCLVLYRGDLIEDLSPREEALESWLRGARDRLRDRVCSVIDRLVDLLVAEQRFDEATEALDRRLTIDPACESAHRQLMEVYTRTGRRTEALRQYEACVRALDRELGVPVEAATKELADAIRRADLVPGWNGSLPGSEIAASEGETPRVAVLPFEKGTPQTDDYFADGITEDIITALSRFHSLHVIARGSTFVYKGQDVPDREVAEALGARFLVRGTVQRAGERVRISLQLLDGAEGINLWVHRFDAEMSDVFAVRDEITSTIVATLAGRVESAEIARARGARAKRLDAYDYLLRGKDLHHRFNPDDCAACIDMFTRAIECDGGYAVAHAWLACGLGQAMVFDLDDRMTLVDRSQAAAERGLELDENESECHRILAQVHLIRGNLARAMRHQERALFLNPNDDRSVCAMGELLVFVGRPEEAEQWVRKSMALNPYHPQRYWTHLARALFHQDRYAETLDTLEQIGRPRSDDLAYAVAASAMREDTGATAQHVEAMRVAFPNFDASSFVDGLPYAQDGDRERLRGALRRVWS